jgi:hypothetical protein
LRSLRLVGIALLIFAAAPRAYAERRESLRKDRILGAMVGLLDPYPSLIGLTLGWNTSSSLRLELGVGRQNLELSHVTTWAVGAKFFVPHWDLTPWASIHVASVSHEGGDPILGFGRSGMHGYAGLGMEWLTPSGFTASFGYHVSSKGNSPSQPMLSIGWFFSL